MNNFGIRRFTEKLARVGYVGTHKKRRSGVSPPSSDIKRRTQRRTKKTGGRKTATRGKPRTVARKAPKGLKSRRPKGGAGYGKVTKQGDKSNDPFAASVWVNGKRKNRRATWSGANTKRPTYSKLKRTSNSVFNGSTRIKRRRVGPGGRPVKRKGGPTDQRKRMRVTGAERERRAEKRLRPGGFWDQHEHKRRRSSRKRERSYTHTHDGKRHRHTGL